MPNLTRGRTVADKDQVGGIKAVYFFNYGPLSVTYDGTDTDLITSLGAVTCYKYDLKDGNASLTETLNQDPAAGTSFWEQSLELTLPKLTKEDQKELKLIAWSRPHVAVLDHNDNVRVCGLLEGMDATGGTIESGTAKGDLTGYRLTLVAQEKTPANFISGTAGSSASAYPFDNLSAIVTITAGS